jgi:ubiquinone/menaquinone biosynthesis C-methylase UbiE
MMRNQEVLPTRAHLKLCGEWFLAAQEPAGGYAASFSFVTGLRHGYIETTGYIIPTMLDLAAALGDERFRASALRAGEWLLSVQQADGSFTDIDDYKPQVFDTGQVMLGLNRLARDTQDARYLTATRRAAAWLTQVQDADGSWTSAGYHRGDACVYLSRVAAAMIESALLTGETHHRAAGEQFLRWAASRQQANGFFLNCELIPGADPVLHTLVYVLEGFLMAYQHTGAVEWRDVLVKGALPLRRAQLERDLVPRSQYNAQWEVTNAEKCIPGLAQWAALCLALEGITGEVAWREAAQLAIYYLKSKQLRGQGILHGALPASVPLWGYYHPMMLPNWTVKFFADALLLYAPQGSEVWQEQEAWVAKCFALRLDGGGWSAHSTKLEAFDETMCAAIHAALARGGVKAGQVLDLGCGAGRYLAQMETLLPGAKLVGVDPQVAAADGKIRRGSAYALPFADSSLDAVYSYIVFQHLHEPARALAEVRRVLKPGGVLVIADRDVFSGRGLKKPWHELKGRWMYPWDSPFRERWYLARKWRRMLTTAGFEVRSTQRLVGSGETGWKRFARVNAFLVVGGVKR